MNDPIPISYTFQFKSGAPIKIDLQLNPDTLESKAWRTVAAPAWVNLDFEQCGNCPLDPAQDPYCPPALRMLQLIQAFGSRLSVEEVTLEVQTLERKFIINTNLQDALRSLFGVIMPTSGCPHLAALKPMARFHLPVGSMAETIYRSTSMYMLAQYFVAQQGGKPDWDMNRLKDIYNRIHEVNQGITKRLLKASARDAAAESLKILDLFTSEVPQSIGEHLDEFKGYFHAFTHPGDLL
jgi:hypothetical protein